LALDLILQMYIKAPASQNGIRGDSEDFQCWSACAALRKARLV
jgi:hypothetical protein